MRKACCGRVVCLFNYFFVSVLEEQAGSESSGAGRFHWRSFSPFLLINDGASPKSEEDGSMWARSALSPPRDYF